MTNWKHISSAPRDGRAIIALWAGEGMSGHAESVQWLNGVWVWEQDGDTPQTDPTHWIPKPPVPPNA